ITAIQQRFAHPQPVLFEPSTQCLGGHAVNAGCPLVPEHPAVSLAHVLAFHNALHERVALRFRLPGCHRAHFSTPNALGQLPAASFVLGPRCQGFCVINMHRDHPSYSRCPLFGPSLSVSASPAQPPTTMPSADFCSCIPPPRGGR